MCLLQSLPFFRAGVAADAAATEADVNEEEAEEEEDVLKEVPPPLPLVLRLLLLLLRDADRGFGFGTSTSNLVGFVERLRVGIVPTTPSDAPFQLWSCSCRSSFGSFLVSAARSNCGTFTSASAGIINARSLSVQPDLMHSLTVYVPCFLHKPLTCALVAQPSTEHGFLPCVAHLRTSLDILPLYLL